MTEFSVIIKHAKRMCSKFYREGCHLCPLSDNKCKCRLGYILRMPYESQVIEVEHDIAEWAQENPEPKYPSYHEAWKQLFPHSEHAPCPLTFGGRCKPERCGTSFCQQCMNRPMHADVAEKLGIKPIGGTEDA